MFLCDGVLAELRRVRRWQRVSALIRNPARQQHTKTINSGEAQHEESQGD